MTAIKEKKPIEFYRSQPELFRDCGNGTFQDTTTNRIVATFPELNPYAITTKTVQQMHLKRKAQKARSQLQGLADVAKDRGADFPDVDSMTDEQLVAASGDTVRLLTRHLANTFLESKNVRGLSESYSKLIEALSEDARSKTPEALPPGVVSTDVSTLLELARQLEAHTRTELDKARAIDAEAWARGET